MWPLLLTQSRRVLPAKLAQPRPNADPCVGPKARIKNFNPRQREYRTWPGVNRRDQRRGRAAGQCDLDGWAKPTFGGFTVASGAINEANVFSSHQTINLIYGHPDYKPARATRS